MEQFFFFGQIRVIIISARGKKLPFPLVRGQTECEYASLPVAKWMTNMYECTCQTIVAL